jgi:selenocysteine lyase/cysteine desulfurase
MQRRAFLTGAAALSADVKPSRGRVADFQAIRADFPWVDQQTFLNSAGSHPISVQSGRAMEKYIAAKVRGPSSGAEFAGPRLEDVKALFARLINAKPSEIAFVQSTMMGENVVVAGLGIPAGGGNVVTDELHYNGSLYLYKTLERAGLDLRIVRHRDWQIDVRDVAKAIDRKTKLIAMTLVSNINGFQHDARSLSDLAHAHGAYLYADIVQAAGAVPIDVRAMGIDFASCSTYKWLMGERGLGYLYVREESQGAALKPTQFGDRQYSNFLYHNFPYTTPAQTAFTWEPVGGASRYEVGNVANIVASGQSEALRFILELGVEKIQQHAMPLIERVRKEVPRLGYPSITPPGAQTPIASFLVKDPAMTAAKLRKAAVVAKVKWNQLRVSVSVFNNQADVDRLMEALA